ncbi:cytochrome c oxidase subunit I [Sandaracinus amylolyticus]|uniref:cytochrome-c oxidase n=1 Tax=Sandaracinus amylolyticus TaxID=927083 RepID=A0A0F6W017_9BACT|nr:cytochrome c oxidase subunit I [Sandaracinus amylolyticus]AKF04012.1 Cytochrome c oxidase polypeptide I [Sandaracinus amylolyticus]
MTDPAPLPDAPPESLRRAQEERLLAVWKSPEGLRYFSDVNNSRVGVWYTAVAFLFFFFGGVLALLMRIQLAVSENDFLSAETYNQTFTVHGSVMMFLFAIPIFEAIAVTLMPQMLGARDLPFPRLAAFGFWCFVIGGLFLSGSIFFDAAPRGGWFMYPPLTSSYQPDIGADIWLLGFSFIEVAAIASAVELIVGALKCRPPGMRIHLIPLYVWYTLVAAVMIVFAFPPLITGSMLLELEREFDWPFFDASRGGDPLLWQHLFWLFGHPEVYIIFLPSIALVAMIVPTFARKPMVGYGWIVLAAIGIGFLSFGLWVHHMYTTGLPGISLGLFSAASAAVAIPTGVQFFCFVATLLVGRVARSVPLLWVIGSMAIFVFGGLTGVMLALAPFDFQAHDSFFVVGHFHYVLIGGAIFPIIAGLYYFYPIVRGKMLSDRLGTIAFWLAFVGFNVAFLPMHLSGMRGMPRRVFTYPAELGLDGLNMASTIGAFVLAAGLFVIAFDMLRPRRKEPYARRNPWDAGTLEWVQEMPGKSWGIRSIPEIDSRHPIWDQPNLIRDIDEGRFYLPDAEEGLRETLVTSVIDARPLQCQRLPGPSWLPLVAAVTLGGFFVLGTFAQWAAALVSLVLAACVIWRWLWVGTAWKPEKAEKDVGLGVRLPISVSGSQSVGWWGLLVTMLADFTAFVSIVFGYFFFWTIHEDFPPPSSEGPGVAWPALGAALVLGAWALVVLCRRLLRRTSARTFHLALLGAIALAVASVPALLAGPYLSGLDPTRHAYDATVWLLLAWTALHVVLGVLMQVHCLARRIVGHMTPEHDIDLHNVVLYWHFTVLTAVITALVVAGFPSVA